MIYDLLEDNFQEITNAIGSCQRFTPNPDIQQLLSEIMLKVINKILFVIQQLDLKDKKSLKIQFLDDIIYMCETIKQHRDDLHMNDNA